ncbi:MFS transporter [Microbacterium halophytorum]|uniref:MFS transporter n=1 Tax=Microbacterium halophytorum TaxID=2067568 RepID=UPI000CFBC64B|nr:MFS transporter [Microbacterium halophytorum]
MAADGVPLRKNWAFQRLVVAKVANELSSSIGNLALPLLVVVVSGSAALAGFALAVLTGALIASQTFAGVLVDRYSPSLMLRGSSAVQAIGWAIVVIALYVPDASVALVLVGAGVAGAASGVDGPSEHALLKVIVPQDQYGRAAALGQGREAAAGLLGAPAGGILVGLAPALAPASQAALNMLAAVFAPRVRHSSPPAADERFLSQLVIGFRAVFHHDGLRGIAIVSGLANLPVVALPLTLIAEYQSQGVSPVLIGVMASAFGVGMVLGSFVAGLLATKVRLGVLGVLSLAGFAGGQIAVLFSYQDFWITTTVLTLSALPLPSFNAAISAYTAAVTPAAYMGRIAAASGVPGMILMPVGSLVAGVLFDHYGALVALLVSAGAAIVTVAVTLLSRALRAIPRLAVLRETDLTQISMPGRT